MPFLVIFRIILAKKRKKSKKSKFCSVNFLDNTLKFILANFQPIWVIFAIFDSFLAFFAFFGKNHNFFQILLGFGSKTGFFEKKIFHPKFCGIEPTYTKFQVITTRNSHFIEIQRCHKDPKFKPPGAISPYVLIQNTENTKMSAKSSKINIFRSNKKQFSLLV